MTIKSSVFVSSGAFRSKTVSDVLTRAADWGIPAVELSSGCAWSPDNLQRAREARKAGLEILIHNYFPPPKSPFVLNLASSDPETLRRAVDHCRAAMDFCKEMGAPLYSVHSGFAVSPRPEDLGNPLHAAPRISLSDARKRFVESLTVLCGHAESLDMTLAVENNVLAGFNLIDGRNSLLLCVTAEDVLQVLDEVRSPRLAVLLDVAHAVVSANSLGFSIDSFIEAVAPHVVAVHVSENDGRSDQNLPIRSDSWFLPHLARLSRAKAIPVVLESYGLAKDQILEGVSILKKAVSPSA